MVELIRGPLPPAKGARGAFKSVAELQYAITEYLDHRIADRETFHLDKVGGQILEKVARAKQAF